jgi:hypothetical protein
MIKPQTTTELLMYNTIRLVDLKGSSGTGFLFNFMIEELIIPVIITNKHVVNYNPKEIMQFFLHVSNGNEPTKENLLAQSNTDWIFHPSKDICFCYFLPILKEIKEKFNKDIFYYAIDESQILDVLRLKELSALEPVIMVGYPNGIWDEFNNFPIFRTGFTSAHPAYDFNEKSIGLVDMACFCGSSGSPIFIYNGNGYSDKNGTLHVGATRLIFIGILYSAPIINLEGEIVIKTIPTQEKLVSVTETMINHGYYIKAHELKEFKFLIEKNLNKTVKNS